MDGGWPQPINRHGDSMWESQCFGDVELEMHEGHQWGWPVASWGYLSARGLSQRAGREQDSTSAWVEIILQVDEFPQAQSHRQRTGPGEADMYFHLWRRAHHLLCWWPASQLFMFIRLIPKYCLPPLISLSTHCLKNSQDGTDRLLPKC